MTRLLPIASLWLLAAAPVPVAAQLANLGAVGGLLGGAGSVGRSNAAGLLGYCVKRKLLGSGEAQGILGTLAGTPAVTGSKDYQAGENGQLIAGRRQFSLDGVKDQVKGRVCELVLNRAQGFAAP